MHSDQWKYCLEIYNRSTKKMEFTEIGRDKFRQIKRFIGVDENDLEVSEFHPHQIDIIRLVYPLAIDFENFHYAIGITS